MNTKKREKYGKCKETDRQNVGFTAVIYRYNSICEPDIKEGFERMGISVVEITEEMHDKSILPSRRVQLVDQAINTYSPLFVFSVNFFPDISDICSIHGTFYLCQTVDSPVMQLFSESIKHETNRIFLFDRAQYLRFHGYNEQNIFHLPLAANVRRYDSVTSGITEDDRKHFSCDISFVGSLYSEKCELNRITLSDDANRCIDALIDEQKKIYGDNFLEEKLREYSGDRDNSVISELKEKLPAIFKFDKPVEQTDLYIAAHYLIGYKLAETERIETLNALAEKYAVTLFTRSDTTPLKGVILRDGVSTHTEMPKIFHLSRINLNMTVRPIISGLPLRIFDIMGCGGFVMSNHQDEIADLFEIGKEIETYKSLDELIDKCGYYLSHEAERGKIARKGYEKVCEKHTWDQRLKEMIRYSIRG
ncbi:MAG: glycosyltransferase [Lachnospiraceae bacterium]|nr:glycosyltransferase [Lachnospiraceae bacterium]